MNNFKEYQLSLYKYFSDFNGTPFWNYPPYCDINDYFEEFFHKNFFIKINNENKTYKMIYIPIKWTYVLKTFTILQLRELQKKIDNLSKEYLYFTVCMHHNAPIHRLPKFTKNFSSGYCCDKNMYNGKVFTEENINLRENIPIPLIVKNKIFNNNISNINKKYLASFLGSDSHMIRETLTNKYINNNKFFIKLKHNPNMENNMDDVNLFIEKSIESYFVLCPRGWSPTSYRLYETMQLNCVPVYISDIFWLPYENEINWNNMCVFIKPDQLNNLENTLEEELKSGNYIKKLDYLNQIYNKYFTFENMFNKIIDNINCGMP